MRSTRSFVRLPSVRIYTDMSIFLRCCIVLAVFLGCPYLLRISPVSLCAFATSLLSADCSNILAFFPHPLASHQDVIRPVVEALGSRGHNVTYISGFPWRSQFANVDHRVVSIDFLHELKNIVFDFSQEPVNEGYLTAYNKNIPSILHAILFGGQTQVNEAKMVISQKLVQDPVVRDLIYDPSEKYDLVMTDALMGYEHFAVLSHRFNATSVVLTTQGDSTWVNEMSGLADNPAYMVDYMYPYSEGPVTPRWARLLNWLALQSTYFHGYKHMVQCQAFVDQFLRYPNWESRPPLTRIVSDQALVLVNAHHAVGHPYPRPPHMKEVGGVSVKEPRPLSPSVLRFVDNARDGVIFFCPGSSLDFSSPYKAAERNIFLEALSRRRERVIWKWSGDPLRQKPDNIMILRDLPESDILAHNNTKLFINQGRMLDIMNAVHFAVPVVGVFNTEEGRRNLMMAEHGGYGVGLSFSEFSIETLNDAIDEVIGNDKFLRNIQEKSKVFRDRLLDPKDESAFWIEYVLRHGRILQPASVGMTFEEVNLWDIYALVGLLLTTVVSIFLIIATALVMAISWAVQRRSPSLLALLKDDKEKSD